MTGPAGLVLAAGAGTRFGRPKATVVDADGTPWMARVAEALCAAGLEPVIVVLGAQAGEALAFVPDAARPVVAPDWQEGVSASLRTGLNALADEPVDAVVVALVDQPGLPAAAVRRLISSGAGRTDLRRLTYDGVPGHPVLIGRDHWAELVASLRGDVGAGPWLAAQEVELVPGDDLWDGSDVDRP